MVAVWTYGVRHSLIPCIQDCGEAFEALQYVANYRLYGFRYGMVQDHATAPNLAAHPYFYTHNVNVAGILFTALELTGVTAFWGKQLVTILGFGAGLLYVYRATAYFTGSVGVALVAMLFFVTDIRHVLAFGLNPLRAWHLLVLFGLLLHAGRFVSQPRPPRGDLLAVFVFAMLAFGIGYDFWVICGALSIITAASLAPCPLLRSRQNRLRLSWIALAFVVPLTLRQIQIAAVLGGTFWFTDVVYSAAIKVPVLSKIVDVPPLQEVDRWYASLGVLRPPASPANSIHQIWMSLIDMSRAIVIPSYGLVTVGIGVGVGGAAFITWAACRGARLARLLGRVNVHGRYANVVVGSMRLIACLVSAVVFGLAFFAPLSFHVYLKHEFPLVAAPLLLTKAIVVAALVAAGVSAWPQRRHVAAISLTLAAFFIVDHVVIQARNLADESRLAASWIPGVTKHTGSSFAISWIPSAASVLTGNWAVGVAPYRERDIVGRIARGERPFDHTDYFLFGERDAAHQPDKYTRPEFWLYFPTDIRVQFDHPAPSCTGDYVGAVLKRIAVRRVRRPKFIAFWASTSHTRPGDEIMFAGLPLRLENKKYRAELIHDGVRVADLNFNCIYSSILGKYRIPLGAEGDLRFRARLIDPEGRNVVESPVLSVRVDSSGPVPPPIPRGAQPPQPTADELIALMRGVEIAERGDNYVIFDLRPYYVQHGL